MRLRWKTRSRAFAEQRARWGLKWLGRFARVGTGALARPGGAKLRRSVWESCMRLSRARMPAPHQVENTTVCRNNDERWETRKLGEEVREEHHQGAAGSG